MTNLLVLLRERRKAVEHRLVVDVYQEMCYFVMNPCCLVIHCAFPLPTFPVDVSCVYASIWQCLLEEENSKGLLHVVI